jgi:hypothetical protein
MLCPYGVHYYSFLRACTESTAVRMQVYTKLGGDDNLRKTIADCESVGRLSCVSCLLVCTA